MWKSELTGTTFPPVPVMSWCPLWGGTMGSCQPGFPLIYFCPQPLRFLLFPTGAQRPDNLSPARHEIAVSDFIHIQV